MLMLIGGGWRASVPKQGLHTAVASKLMSSAAGHSLLSHGPGLLSHLKATHTYRVLPGDFQAHPQVQSGLSRSSLGAVCAGCTPHSIYYNLRVDSRELLFKTVPWSVR